MTEYIALVFVFLGLMVYLIHLAFSMNERYEPLKILLVGVSMIFGILLIHLGKAIAVDQGASTAILNAMDIGYYVWITITCIVLIYIAIYIIPDTYKLIKNSMKKEKKDLYGDT